MPHDSRPARRPPSRRRVLQAAGLGTLAAGAATWSLLPDGEPAPRGDVVLATGVPGGVYARYGALLRERMAAHHEDDSLRLLLRPSEGSVENLGMLLSGEADFTIAQSDAVADHLARRRPGGGRLRACARLYDDYLQLVVRDDSPVRRPRDLAGLRVGTGEAGSGISAVAGHLLRAAGLDPEDDVTSVPAGLDRMPGMLEHTDLDAFFWSGGLPTTAITALTTRLRIRLVPLGELVPRLHGQGGTTGYLRAAVMPADAYPGAADAEAVDTVAVPNLLLTTREQGAARTEAVTRAVIRSRDAIGSRVHAAQKVDLRTAVYTGPLALHEGARRYYRAAKP